jgi:hypothetical protein
VAADEDEENEPDESKSAASGDPAAAGAIDVAVDATVEPSIAVGTADVGSSELSTDIIR